MYFNRLRTDSGEEEKKELRFSSHKKTIHSFSGINIQNDCEKSNKSLFVNATSHLVLFSSKRSNAITLSQSVCVIYLFNGLESNVYLYFDFHKVI